jgi:hypothetical protein
MADQTKTSPTQPRPKGSRPVRAAEADPEVTEVVEVIEETTIEAPVVEEVVEEVVEVVEDDVEAMGKRGRKSKSQIAEEHRRTREDIESNYANLIAHEPGKADLFREELREVLKKMGL